MMILATAAVIRASSKLLTVSIANFGEFRHEESMVALKIFILVHAYLLKIGILTCDGFFHGDG